MARNVFRAHQVGMRRKERQLLCRQRSRPRSLRRTDKVVARSVFDLEERVWRNASGTSPLASAARVVAHVPLPSLDQRDTHAAHEGLQVQFVGDAGQLGPSFFASLPCRLPSRMATAALSTVQARALEVEVPAVCNSIVDDRRLRATGRSAPKQLRSARQHGT